MPQTLQKVYFLDRRSDESILGVEFKDGLSVPFVTDSWITKLRQVGDGQPFDIRTEKVYSEQEYQKLKNKMSKVEVE
jgi:hypothetical protein